MHFNHTHLSDKRFAGLAGRQQRGFNLLEVLIALVVLSLGLLGLAALQNMGLRLGNESYQRSQATLLIYEMIDRMRANAVGVQTGAYALPLTNTAPAVTQDCTLGGIKCSAAQMAAYDMNQWISTITGTNNGTNVVQTPPRPTLSGGEASIVLKAALPNDQYVYDVSIQWQEQDVTQVQTVTAQLP